MSAVIPTQDWHQTRILSHFKGNKDVPGDFD
jgi:hypothetical protein